MKTLVMFAVLVSLAQAQSSISGTTTGKPNDAKCPLEIVRVSVSTSGQYVQQHHLRAEYRNISGKEIRAIKFGALFFNALDEPFESYTNYLDADGLSWDPARAANGGTQKTKVSTWSLLHETVENTDFFPLKVKFADGTFWQDDGNYSCNAGVPALNIAKNGGLASQSEAMAELQRKLKKSGKSPDNEN